MYLNHIKIFFNYTPGTNSVFPPYDNKIIFYVYAKKKLFYVSREKNEKREKNGIYKGNCCNHCDNNGVKRL